MQAQLLLVALLSAAFAGCFKGESDPPAELSPCIDEVCLANPASKDAQYVQATYGLTQITNDSWQEESVQTSGNWVIWDYGRGNERDGYFDPLYGYNLTSKELVGIVTHPDEGVILPHLDDDRVIFHHKLRNGTTAMKLWDFQTRETITVDVGLEGNQFPDSFDGSWVVFRNRGSSNDTENAYWAWNLDDHRRIYLYKPLPQNRQPNGSYETYRESALENGAAYYAIVYADSLSQFFNATIFAVNLTSREQTHYDLVGGSFARLSVSGNLLAAQAGGEIWALDLTNATFWQVNLGSEISCKLGSLDNKLLTYSCSQVPGRSEYYAALVNFVTGQRVSISLPNLPILYTVLDGETWILQALRGPQRPGDPDSVYDMYETFYTDLYSMKVPR